MRLLNVVMQLRKVASHPFLFDWPIDHRTGQAVINKDLVEASGKMLLLNRLLDALFERKHKVLLFSQFTTMLNIIEVSLTFAVPPRTRTRSLTPPLFDGDRTGRSNTRASRSIGSTGRPSRSTGRRR